MEPTTTPKDSSDPKAVDYLNERPPDTVGRKILHIFSFGVLVAATICFLVALFWLLYPYKTTTVTTPIEILNERNTVRIGEPIEMRLEIFKEGNFPPETTTYISCTGGNLIPMAGQSVNLPVGEYVITSDRYILPNKALPGSSCVFHFRVEFKVNPLRHITKEWFSETFVVEGGGIGSGGNS